MRTTEHSDAKRNARDKFQWRTLCVDIARVLHVEPHQIERVVEPPGREMILIVTVAGKDHIVSIQAMVQAKKDAINDAHARARRAEEAIRARRTPVGLVARWVSKWGTKNADKTHMVESDGTVDLHPSQWKLIDG